jgi:hypothetical protein
VSKGNEEMVEALLECGADPRRLFGHPSGSFSTDKAQYDEPSLSTLVLSLIALTFSHAYSSAERRINALLAAHRDVCAPQRMTSKRKRPSSPSPQAHHTVYEPDAPTHQRPKKREVDDHSLLADKN